MLGIKIVQQNNVGLVTFLGKYSRQFESGLHFYIPFFLKGYAPLVYSHNL